MKVKKIRGILFTALLGVSSMILAGCSQGANKNQVIIYTNADDEAVEAMKNALDHNGFEDQYILQSFGTSELGGKLLAEGNHIEADLVTMSSFYVESAQQEKNMFLDLSFETKALEEYPSYYTPITALEGTIIYNTEALKESNLPVPASLADLADSIYSGNLSVTDIQGSSTGWLLVQALISEYGEEEAQNLLRAIYTNAGAHLESSGSGPIKKVRTGEVALGFGLRHQAVADQVDGLPIDYIDPKEGNFILHEGISVVDKGDKTNALAMDMAECLLKESRSELIKIYPVPFYEGESVEVVNASKQTKVFEEKLTVELLERHQALSEGAK